MSTFVVDFDPSIIDFTIFGFPVSIRWYGLMYVVAYIVGIYIARYLARKKFFKVPVESIDSFVTHLLIGMVVGARIFYVFIYNWDYYINNLAEIPAVWTGGLSFHGAVIGMAVGSYIFGKKHNLKFYEVADALSIAGSQGLFFGRMGNFINGELYGRVTDSPFGMIFKSGGPYPRHPSQLYEGLTEGLVLFAILFFVHKKQKHYGLISAIFIAGYGLFRYVVEFFRQPDAQLGYYFGGTTTMGQILCLIMIAIGVGVFFHSKKLNLPVDPASQN